MLEKYARAYIETDIDNVLYNMDAMHSVLKPGTMMTAVLKADGYGHGAIPIAKALEERKYIWGYAAATPEEAFMMRKCGIKKNILILGTSFPYSYRQLAKEEIRPAVYTGEMIEGMAEAALSPQERRLAGALMRVNHVGEVCAQALYTAQASVTRNSALRAHLLEAAREEGDHLAWTRERLNALGARPSLLNPLWYAGAFAVGVLASKVSDQVSLGFVVETENQVAAHLHGHLRRLPEQDLASRAVVARMKDDEERHAMDALAAGAVQLPAPAQALMTAAAKVMTTTAHYL